MFVSEFSPLHRHLALQSNSLDRALKRLSTGLRLTSAADDAAGSSISTKLRSQVMGYNQASRNIQDATSMLQTADAGMEGIQDYLQRIPNGYTCHFIRPNWRLPRRSEAAVAAE